MITDNSTTCVLYLTLFMIPIAMLPCFPDFGIAGFTASIFVLTFGIIMLYPALMLFKTLEEFTNK